MATTWSPMTQLDRKQWLLTNGEVVTEPDLETTTTGRKVRVAGNPDLSVFAKDLDRLLNKAVERVAQSKQTSIWMPLAQNKTSEGRMIGAYHQPGPARLHLIHHPSQRHAITSAWWRFKHPTLPVEALLMVTLQDKSNYDRTVTTQELYSRLIMPVQSTVLNVGDRTHAQHYVEADPTYNGTDAWFGVYDDRLKWRTFVRDNPPTWPADLLSTDRYAGERVAVQALLKKIQVAEGLQTIQIPDLRDPQNPAWLDLELFDTNVNAAFVEEVKDYLDGSPSIEVAARLYEELRTVMRRVGVVMDAKDNNSFQAALATGNKKPLLVDLGFPAEVGHGHDTAHRLRLDLTTGTFIVECDLHGEERDEIAQKWEEAMLVAKMTGEEDTLLAYARRYAEGAGKRRADQILKERSPES